MTTFITTLDATGAGPRLAVKDLIDVAGVPTTAGCRAVARTATPAVADAACLAGARAADARIVGKTNLHELAMLPLGTNPWFGTPVNPLDRTLIPGGSSSGSAVAVATGQADIALGSDTGGSIRVPSACCGTVGLKTHGRVSVAGVRPLAPSLDTVGPMASSVAGAAAGMALLEPGFRPDPTGARVIGRLRTAGDPRIEAAVDDALRAAEFDVIPID
jgi:amidase